MDGTPDPPFLPASPGRSGRPGSPSRPQLHVVFAVDVSGSMAGDRIASLNYAVRAALPALRDAAADNPDVAVLIRVLAFGDAAVWPVPTPVPVESFGWTDLAASGETSMGAAFSCLAAALSTDAGAEDAQDAPPAVVILLSDGLPTDAVEAPLAAFLRSAQGGRAIRIAIAIGAEADLGLLREFIAEPTVKPLRADDAAALVERIRWAATVPVRAAAKVAGGDGGRQTPPGALAGDGIAGDGIAGDGIAGDGVAGESVAEDLTW